MRPKTVICICHNYPASKVTGIKHPASVIKKILIISPHFPPSNLAAVHRSRLFAQHLPSFGWEPIILTVHENYYEEALDHNLEKLLPADLRIEKVKAFSITKPRLIGDIGLRAFFQLHKRAKQLIQSEKIDFLYIPIPSFYCALLGRWLNKSNGIKYGIDYIDPWVHHFPGSKKIFSRHWFSTKIAGLLEPVAVKKASLVTGVAEGYYKGVLERNSHLQKKIISGAMPYGGEEKDHQFVEQLSLKPYLFQKKQGIIQFVYAGAMLPKAYLPLEKIFAGLQKQHELCKKIEFHFIGTGRLANNSDSYTIKDLAEKYQLWQTTVYEYPPRIPYLDVLVHLSHASAIFIIGSTEPHYTPSKTYQAVLSAKPILAVLHNQSTAVEVITASNAGMVLAFEGEAGLQKIEDNFTGILTKFIDWVKLFDPADVNKEIFEKYSAKNITHTLSELINEAVAK
ncbi:MAG: hypothetical protein ABI707_15065 [Ferruginibacter sp.]